MAGPAIVNMVAALIHRGPDDGGFETFTYNNFGQVLAHEMTSGGTETFVYDSHGLKMSYTDATNRETDYSYYTSGPWTEQWRSWPEAQRFWQQAVRWTFPEPTLTTFPVAGCRCRTPSRRGCGSETTAACASSSPGPNGGRRVSPSASR